ncbi:BPSS1780 family membrane protein [Pseudoduganella violaceinigra]|uniref:BPSS1780 family membrane protein n=1 Tax=Pseudoduganella violaceinigra TaxID=246602 RepID=UPI0003F76309|nr:BPSS1780 family membrane protein [Pseudoduganella violaceinigra]
MSNIPASAGVAWIREGFAIFRKQPGGLMLMMLAYLVASVLLAFVPLLGQVLPMILAPVFTAVFVQACAAADRSRPLTPEMLRPIFQKPVFSRLTGLGTLLMLVLLMLLLLFVWMVGLDVMRQLAEQKLKPEAVAANGNFGLAMLVVFLLSLPISMAMLFAAPLIFWQQMGVGKALFYSFFAVWRALRAFLLYFLCWMAIVMLLTNLVYLLVGMTLLGKAVQQSALMVVMMVIQCSVYAAYKHIFGEPQLPAEGA